MKGTTTEGLRPCRGRLRGTGHAPWVYAATASLLVLAPLARASGAATAGGPTPSVSVQLLTDRLDPVAGGVVRLRDGSSEHVLVTDVDGQTSWVGADPSTDLELVLGEVTIAGGTLLGLVEHTAATVLPDPSSSHWWVLVSRTQPLAVPVQIEGVPGRVNHILPPPGDTPHWSIAVQADSSLRFPARVGTLLDREEIEEFLAYRGYTPPPGVVYVKGVDLVVPAVDLGAEGLLVGMDLFRSLPEGAVVDVLNFQSEPFAARPGDPLQALQEGTLDDVVYTCLVGGVHRGHLTLLARSADGPPPAMSVIPDAPPDLVIPAEGDGGVRRGVGPNERRDGVAAGGLSSEPRGARAAAPASPPTAPVTDCIPQDPNPPADWTCTPPTPSPVGDSDSAIPVGGQRCAILRAHTPTRCSSAGGRVELSRSELSKWKAHFQLSLGTARTPFRFANGFEYGGGSEGTEKDVWAVAGGANGLGQCMRVVRTDLVCAQEWRTKYRVVTAFAPEANGIDDTGSIEHTLRTVCTDVIESAVACDRIP